MTKKKRSSDDKNKNIPEENDDRKMCMHMRQSINITHLKKGLREFSKHGECQKCPSLSKEEPPCIYVCLMCGHQGCDRSSQQKHAIRHYEMARTHCCAINTENLQIWCYKCDDFQSSSLQVVQDCRDIVHRIFKKDDEPEILSSNNTDEVATTTTHDKTNDAIAPTNKNKPSSIVVANVYNEFCFRVKGLANLGNTCFFNSVMQCINQTYLFDKCLRTKDNNEVELNFYSKDDDDEDDDGDGDKTVTTYDMPVFKKKSLKVKLSASTGMTKALLAFYEDMKPGLKKGTTHSPGCLFESICSKAAQFRGYQQQDSHELLRHLLDGVREEELKKLQAGILNTFKVDKSTMNTLPSYKIKQIKAFGKSAKHTSADETFGGCFLSTVTCGNCHTPNQIYESFLDISLPITTTSNNKNREVEKVKPDFGKVLRSSKKDFIQEDIPKSKHLLKKEKKNDKKLKKQQNKKNKTTTTSINQFNKAGKEDENLEEEEEDNDDDAKENGDDNDAKENGDDNDAKENGDDNDASNEKDLEDAVASLNLIGGENGPTDDWELNNFLTYGDFETNDEILEEAADIAALTAGFSSADVYDQEIHITDQDYNGYDGEYVEYYMDDESSFKPFYEKKLEAMKLATTPLGERNDESNSGECSVTSCLHSFTSSELLAGNNRYICDHCNKNNKDKTSKYSMARRQILIFAPPVVLTLHLKRFQQTESSIRKLNGHVPFKETIDLGPYCSSLAQNVNAGQTKVLYSLYGVVEHSGSMRGGHYTCYVKVREENKDSKKFLHKLSHENYSSDLLIQLMEEKQKQTQENLRRKRGVVYDVTPPSGKWFYISDSHVSEVKDVSNVYRCQAYILFYERIF